MGKPSDSELLRFAHESGILSLESIQLAYEMAKRQQYLEMHDHKVWQGRDGGWFTYLVSGKKRKLVRKSDKAKLEDAIVAHYRALEENPTVPILFEKWNEGRFKNHEICPNSYSKYKTDFKRFFHEDDDFCKMPIKDIKESDLVEFIKMNIIRYELTQKVYASLRLLIIGIFKYAKLYRLTEISISTFIPRRSTHKIRKTYASKLIDARVEDSIIKAQMGHRDIKTTRGYYYFQTHDNDYLNQEIERAIK